jgi:hypothetical protein
MVIERTSPRRRRDSCGARREQRVIERGCGHRRAPRQRVPSGGGRVFFYGRISQHMERPRAGDWLAGGAMLVAAAAWAVVASFLAG